MDLAGVTIVNAGAAWTNLDPFAQATSNADTLGLTTGTFVANPTGALALATLKASTGSKKPLLAVDPTLLSRRLI